MLVRTDLRGRTLTAAELRQAMPRGGSDPSAVTDTVATLVEDIHQHGASAALSYGEKFDGIRPPQFVSPQTLSPPRSLLQMRLSKRR